MRGWSLKGAGRKPSLQCSAFVADTWLSLCMRFAQVRYASLTDAVRLLGCFARDDVIAECVNGEPTPKQDSVFNTFFCTFDDET